MPLNDFFSFSIESNDTGHIKAILTINRDHEILKGHFPGNPVTPGVTQIEMVRKVLSTGLNKELRLKEAKDLKFIAPVLLPHTHGIELIIDYTEIPEGISVKCVLSRNNRVFTKIRGTFSE